MVSNVKFNYLAGYGYGRFVFTLRSLLFLVLFDYYIYRTICICIYEIRTIKMYIKAIFRLIIPQYKSNIKLLQFIRIWQNTSKKVNLFEI